MNNIKGYKLCNAHACDLSHRQQKRDLSHKDSHWAFVCFFKIIFILYNFKGYTAFTGITKHWLYSLCV